MTTIVRELVDPNGPGGRDGPPLRRGVLRVTRMREHGPAVTVTFNPPRADLLDTDFDALTDDEIAKLGHAKAVASDAASASGPAGGVGWPLPPGRTAV